MRKIFYVPANKDIEDYKSQWDKVVTEIVHGVSENIKDYITNEEVGQLVYIPEYRVLDTPRNISNASYFQIIYFDDFESIKEEKPEVICEIWKKNLDNPSEAEVKYTQYPLHFVVGKRNWVSDHLKLPIGWFDFVIKVDGVEVESAECAVYEYNLEEE